MNTVAFVKQTGKEYSLKYSIRVKMIFFLFCMGCANNCFAAECFPDTFLIKKKLQQAANWQISHFGYSETGTSGRLHDYGINAWTNAVLYIGMAEWAKIAGEESLSYYQWLYDTGEKSRWALAENFVQYPRYGLYHADEFCIGQFYLEMYTVFQESHILESTRNRLDRVLANRPKQDVGFRNKQNWSWCDALFMAPPVYSRVAAILQNGEYLSFMDKQFKNAHRHLYDRQERLFFRDDSFFEKKERNGCKLFWGRGNGWVAAGLVNLLKSLPEESEYKPFYINLFKEFIPRLVSLQDQSGYWHASLLDPESYPAPESSATALITYAIAYGINQGWFSRSDYFPALEKAWKVLASFVNDEGKLGWVQPIGADPKKVTVDMTSTYGVGAFLLAGSEIYKINCHR